MHIAKCLFGSTSRPPTFDVCLVMQWTNIQCSLKKFPWGKERTQSMYYDVLFTQNVHILYGISWCLIIKNLGQWHLSTASMHRSVIDTNGYLHSGDTKYCQIKWRGATAVLQSLEFPVSPIIGFVVSQAEVGPVWRVLAVRRQGCVPRKQ